MARVPTTHLELPAYGLRAIDVLERAGFEAWVVGGWVRDELMGRPSHDVDVCSNARWQQAARAFADAGIIVHETGTAHGTITVVIDEHPIEVTTYRVEGPYSDQRHPDSVTFVGDVEADLARRDLTVNAMAWHPVRGLLDPYGGQADIERHLVRAVGSPDERLAEDALRVLRAVRFACRLSFEVEPATQEALVRCAPELAHVARERVGMELEGILASGRGGWALTHETRVMAAAVPALGRLEGFEQRSPYHCYDVLVHTAHVMDSMEQITRGEATQRLRWASLLHDIAKPRCLTVDARGQGHFFGHPAEGARMADSIMRDMAIPLAVTRPAVALVRLHDRPVKATRASMCTLLANVEALAPGMAPEVSREVILLKRADALAKAEPYRAYATELLDVERVLSQVLSEGVCWRVGDLAVGGGDVMEATGIAPGPVVGERLKALLADVMAGRVPNEREALLERLRTE
jgi:tRNA nucleotidyltransferase (CCA-adding enzyme)